MDLESAPRDERLGGYGCRRCLMTNGRFAVLGGMINASGSSCGTLGGIADIEKHWEALSPMHVSRYNFACVVVAECIIVAGGGPKSAEVYDGVLDRWLRLLHALPHESEL
eukprot:CAMPEP_0181377108 /NCGR_PEP_ID=MMETSP1106-20121128/17708_1 /TAXON_ID=81844 /ORGANISM="Mantoniella antarctica, Strain SL-175" /LENGTH=109 /DNA_ID=CAMNT_0023495795 /DNA_START=754 /DNA_END=1079 /DNA_ORIENTATION=+